MRRVLLFTKEPAPGRVKTRLGAVLGMARAADLARVLLADTLRWALAGAAIARAEVWVVHSPDDPSPDFRGWLEGISPALRLAPQGGGDLGVRLSRGLAGPGARVALGMDAPDLAPERLAEAFAALEESQLVLGPTPDGGYYLLGLAEGASAGFLEGGIEWSAATTRDDTLLAARSAGLAEVELLGEHPDVDDLASLRSLAERLARAPSRAPDTRSWLLANPGIWGSP